MPAGVDPATIAREKAVLADKNAGKPPHVLEKIVESGLKTYLQGGLPARSGLCPRPRQIGRPGGQGGGEERSARRSRVKGFVRYALGEGVEKPAEEA